MQESPMAAIMAGWLPVLVLLEYGLQHGSVFSFFSLSTLFDQSS
jgi:hypothetical protein